MKKESGYILPFVLVALVLMMIGANALFLRNTDATVMSADKRDKDLANLMAESSVNWLSGRLYNDDFGVYSTPCGSGFIIADLNCDGSHDNPELRPTSLNPALPLAVGYSFFLNSGGTEITENSPGLLQRIADGEAAGSTASVGSQSINKTTAQISANGIFVSNSIHPIMLTNSNNGLVISNQTWTTESADSKAMVFIELTRNPSPKNSSWIDIWVCSVAKVGKSRAYGMRYIGSFTDTLGGAIPAAISESATHG